MKRAAIILLCAVLGGCASPELVKPEATWQVLHAVDVAQTMRLDDCHHEANGITTQFIGRQPSRAAVAAWGVGLGVLHWAAGSWLEDRWPRVWAVWEFVTIAEAGAAVYNNQQAGIRLGSANVCHAR